MKFIEEFKAFAMKGNVVDMAVGVVVGGAFGKIVTSLVNDIIMPVISIIVGKINIKELALVVGSNGEGEAVSLNYGLFLQNIIDFLIIALSIFVVIKIIGKFRVKKEAVEEAAAAAEEATPDPDIVLLTEIRDLLKKD